MLYKPGKGVTGVEILCVGLLFVIVFALLLPRLRQRVENEKRRHTLEVATFIANQDTASLAAALKQHDYSRARLAGGASLLHAAAEATNYGAVELLLDHGVDVNFETDSGWTPLHYALENPHHGSSHDDQFRLITLLLDEGANVNARTEEGRTPLYLAARKKEPSFATLLLNRGAEVDSLLDFFDDLESTPPTPLTVAGYEGSYNSVLVLLENGAEVNPDSTAVEDSPLHWTARGKEYGKDSAIVSLLIERGADVSAGEAKGVATPLHVAAKAGATDTVRLLIDHGANVNAVVLRTGETPLHFASRGSFLETVRVLLDAGADVDALAGEQQKTPREMANYYAHERVADLIRLYQERDMKPERVAPSR